MEIYRQNTMARFRNVVAEPVKLGGAERVALPELNIPLSIKIFTTKGYFVCTPTTLFIRSPHHMKKQNQEA